jgi:hypothetical protein
VVALGDGGVEKLDAEFVEGVSLAVVQAGRIVADCDGFVGLASVEVGAATCDSGVDMSMGFQVWPLLLWGQALEIGDASDQASSIPVAPIESEIGPDSAGVAVACTIEIPCAALVESVVSLEID